MPDVWTVKAILDWCEGYLARKNDPNPRLSAQWLLSEALGLSRIELYTSFDKPLTASERDTMREWVRRRGAGEPLQLISGKAPFRYITVSVKEGVLIPRPETEVLVSEAFEELALPRVSERVVVCDEAEVIESSDAYPISVLDLVRAVLPVLLHMNILRLKCSLQTFPLSHVILRVIIAKSSGSKKGFRFSRTILCMV